MQFLFPNNVSLAPRCSWALMTRCGMPASTAFSSKRPPFSAPNAFNFDRRESVLDYYAPGALRELVSEQANIINIADTAVLTARIEEQSQGTPLWRWCLTLALCFLAAEILLLRLWKV